MASPPLWGSGGVTTSSLIDKDTDFLLSAASELSNKKDRLRTLCTLRFDALSFPEIDSGETTD